jgi:hypothetical protein
MSIRQLTALHRLATALQCGASSLSGRGVAELADGPNGCGEVARGGCAFAWNFSVTRPGVKKTLDPSWRCRYINDSPLANRLKIPPAKNHVLYYASVVIFNPGCAFYLRLREQITPYVATHTQLIPRWPHTQPQLNPRVAKGTTYSTWPHTQLIPPPTPLLVLRGALWMMEHKVDRRKAMSCNFYSVFNHIVAVLLLIV